MPLLTDELKARLPPVYSQEGADEPIVCARYFLPETSRAWYVIEGERQGDDFLFFGFVFGEKDEFAYFLLSDLESLRGAFGLAVERDENFKEGKLTDVVPPPPE
jgi:hypothetical protein